MILSRVAAACIVGVAMSAGAQQNAQSLIIGEQFTLHSSVLKDDRYFDDETHLSVPLVAIYAGLLFAYEEEYERPIALRQAHPH